ncbi:MAG: hypothetical protein SH820_10820 [Xanthomonadales bacterium]|nr:hypothetical protein [Xanthomonadales bacterium]
MSKVHSERLRTLHPHTLFRLFKYAIYCLLALNIYLFFSEEYLASIEVFGDSLSLGHIIKAFSATIDTAAWVVLLLIFELETAVIPDEKLEGGLKWLLFALKAVAYAFIVWAFWGYAAKWSYLAETLPFAVDNVCSLIGQGFSWVDDLDQYPALDAASCAALQGQALWQITGTQIIGRVDAVKAIQNLAMVDIINAADWLIIVVLLEVEVFLQLGDQLNQRRLLIAKITKGLLYTVLFFCAVYWGLLGDFLDFWDAFLWLVAFIFIEMNIFQWHEENAEEKLEEINHPTEDIGVVSVSR